MQHICTHKTKYLAHGNHCMQYRLGNSKSNQGIPYSRKIWRELNLAKSAKTAKIKYWRNLNLAIVYGEGYDVINYFGNINFIFAGEQCAMLLSMQSFLSLRSRMEALDSLILLSGSFEKSVAAFVAPLSAAYFPIRALLASKTSVILASRCCDRLRVSR